MPEQVENANIVPDEQYTIADAEFLNRLKNNIKSITKALDSTGTRKYPDSIEAQELKQAVYTLIGELQFHNITPCNLHIANGTVIKHL